MIFVSICFSKVRTETLMERVAVNLPASHRKCPLDIFYSLSVAYAPPAPAPFRFRSLAPWKPSKRDRQRGTTLFDGFCYCYSHKTFYNNRQKGLSPFDGFLVLRHHKKRWIDSCKSHCFLIIYNSNSMLNLFWAKIIINTLESNLNYFYHNLWSDNGLW